MTIYVVYYISIILFYGLLYTFDFYWKPRDNVESLSGEICYKKWKYDTKWFIIISIGVLILIFGLRSQEMGNDLINAYNTGYLPSFVKINGYSWREIFQMESFLNYEKGYVVFNKLVGIIAVNRQFFLLVCAAVSLIPVGLTIYRYSSMPLISMLVYMGLPTFVILFSALRQAIAVSITLLAFPMIKQRRKLMFVLLILLASTFHSSAVIFLIGYPLYHMKTNNSIMAVQTLLLPVIWLLRKPLFELITKFIYGYPRIDDNGDIGLFLVFTMIYIFAIIYGDRKNNAANGLMNLFWPACAIQSVAGMYSTALRMGYYFLIYLILLLPEIFKDMKTTSKPWQRKTIIVLVMASFVIFGYFQIKNTYWSRSYPYVFFWNQKQ